MTINQRRNFLSNHLKKKIDRNFENGGLTETQGNMLIENFIGGIKLPLGIGKNFKINGKKILIPMVTEEPSVIAAASYAAKLICGNSYGFRAVSTRNIMRGQIFLKNIQVLNPLEVFNSQKEILISYANDFLCKTMFDRGGGVSDIHLKKNIKLNIWTLDVLIDVQDSIGANTINTTQEGLAPKHIPPRPVVSVEKKDVCRLDEDMGRPQGGHLLPQRVKGGQQGPRCPPKPASQVQLYWSGQVLPA